MGSATSKDSGSLLLYPGFKRLLDIVLALLGIVVLWPILLLVMVAIKLDSRGPVLFRQKRFGINRSYFQMFKFRTMKTDAPADTPTHLMANPLQHTTRVGRFLRQTSLDELPQLLNILVGKMSVVGPRPALWNQDDLIDERDKYGANAVRPGLTGWAQINGRDELPIEVKAKLDGEYVEQMSLWMDVRCVVGTIAKVLSRDGVLEGGTGASGISGAVAKDPSAKDEHSSGG